MGLKRSKKKKKGLKSLRSTGGGSSVETSPLRPVHQEKIPPCMNACPQGTDIRKLLTTVGLAEKKEIDQDVAFTQAFEVLVENNPFPSVCGRVCPHPCEDGCNRKEKEGAASINQLERFLGDYGLDHGLGLKKHDDAGNYDEKVAIIGAGPAGLSCAFHLAKHGYPVTVFEAFDKAGGMLRYGIPAYRLPRDILDAEIKRICDMGVELKCNTSIGNDIPYEDIQKEYNAIFVGIGAHQGRPLRVEGEDAENFMTGAEFLNKVNSGEKVAIGKKVVVIGGGDTAIDAARMARRMGAEAAILYRRTRTEMPAIDEEIEGAEEEGVSIELLAAPEAIVKDGDRAVKMVFKKCELGEPDDSGRRRPVPVEGSEYDVEADFFVAAISQAPSFEGLEAVGNPKTWVKADEWMQTENDNVFGGGDVLDLGLVTIAIGQGRRAATSIHENFRGMEHSKPQNPPPVIEADKLKLGFYEETSREEPNHLAVEARFAEPDAEINQGLTREQAIAEAKRCMSCGSCFECGECWSYCQDQAVIKPLLAGQQYKFKLEFCNGCKKCAEQCPCGYIELHMPGDEPTYDKL
jgi:NADPH-dependent glutamate synthase beta subunit-like oxidoreductase